MSHTQYIKLTNFRKYTV